MIITKTLFVFIEFVFFFILIVNGKLLCNNDKNCDDVLGTGIASCVTKAYVITFKEPSCVCNGNKILVENPISGGFSCEDWKCNHNNFEECQLIIEGIPINVNKNCSTENVCKCKNGFKEEKWFCKLNQANIF